MRPGKTERLWNPARSRRRPRSVMKTVPACEYVLGNLLDLVKEVVVEGDPNKLQKSGVHTAPVE